MFHVDRRSRGIFAGGACLCFIAAIAVTPRSARSAVAPSTGGFRHIAHPESALPELASLAIRRDPFAGSHDSEFSPADLVRPPFPAAAFAPLPPHLDAAAPVPLVAAVVTGPHALALIDRGDAREMKGVGESVAGSRITAIDLDGIRLADGRHIGVRMATAPLPVPVFPNQPSPQGLGR